MPARSSHNPSTSSDLSASTTVTLPRFLHSLTAWDSVLFAAICLTDMLTTLYWVRHGVASEANPWLAACLARGVGDFCAAKLVSFLPVLCIAAYYRDRYPAFIPAALRLGMIGYVIVYFVGIASQLFTR